MQSSFARWLTDFLFCVWTNKDSDQDTWNVLESIHAWLPVVESN